MSSPEVVAKSGASPSNTKAEGASAGEESPLEAKPTSDLHPGAPKPPIANHTELPKRPGARKNETSMLRQKRR